MLNAYYGGRQSGIIATIFAALVADYFLILPHYSFSLVHPEKFLVLILFGIEGVAITYMIVALHRARRKAECVARRLEESEKHFSSFMDNLPGVAFVKDINGRHLFINKTFEKIFNWSSDDAWYGKRNEELFPEEIAEQFKKNDRLVIQENKKIQTIELIQLQDGTYHHYLINKFPIYNNTENPVLLGGIGIEITDRILAEQALKESELKFRSIFQEAAIGMALIDPEGIIRETNPALQRILGYTHEEICHLGTSSFSHPEDLEIKLKLYQEVISGKRSRYQLETRYLCKDGQVVWGRLNVSVVKNAEGKLTFAIATVEDITEQKRDREELYHREQEFKALVENSPDIISRFDREFRHVYVNPAIEKATGISQQTFIGKNHQELGMPEEKTRVWQNDLRYVFQSGEELISGFDFVTPTGKKYYHSRLVPELGREGLVESVLGVAHDITKQKEIEQALQETLQRLNFHVENSPLAVIEWDFEFRVSRWSQEAEKLFGWTSEELLGQRPYDWSFVYPEDLPDVKKLIQDLYEGDEHRNVSYNRNYCKDGSIVYCEWYNSALLDETGQLVSVLSLVLDVSKRQHAEAAAIQASDRTSRLQAITASLSAALTPVEVADVIVEQALSTSGACRGVVTLLNETKNELEILRSVGYPPESVEAWHRFPLTASVPLAEAVRTQQPVFLKTQDALINQYPQLLNLQAGLCSAALAAIPLALEEETLGSLGLGFSEARQWSEEDAAFILALARQCAQAIKRAQLYSAEQKARAEAEASEQRFRFLAEAIPQIVWTAQANGYKDYYNQRWFKYTGITLEENQTIGAEHFSHPDDRQGCIDAFQEALGNKGIFQVEQRLRRADGSYRWHLTRAVPMLDGEGEIIKWFGTSTDIDDRKQAEESLRETNERFKFLSETASSLLLNEHPQEFIDSLFQKLSVHLGLEVYLNYLINHDEQVLELHSYRGISEATSRNLARLELGQTICGIVALNRETVVAEDVQSSSQKSLRHLLPIGISAYACYPLIAREQLIGTLSFGTRQRPRFEPHEMELMQVVCTQVATALERAQLISQLQQQAEDLASANRMKDEFLAVLSHELRTPLNSMLGWAKLLRTRNFDAATTTRALEIIERNAVAQAQLIEDILDVSRIIRGNLSLQLRPINLVTVIEAAIDTVRSTADAKEIQIQFPISAFVGQVAGDSDRLQQVIWNLLSNAIKFTPKGGSVEVRLSQMEDQVLIDVIDTGNGIAPSFLPYVFDRFRQADASITRVHGGLGLGLAIVRHLVELHGGTIHAESEGEGKGATFTVKLPLLKLSVEEKALSPQFSGIDRLLVPLNNLQVLIVDDEADARELLLVVLEQTGAEVKAVTSAAEALSMIERSRPDILISDIGMPGEDGYSLIRKVRAWEAEAGGTILAIALTAYARDEDRRQAEEAGFQMHISKPIEPKDLIEALLRLSKQLENGE